MQKTLKRRDKQRLVRIRGGRWSIRESLRNNIFTRAASRLRSKINTIRKKNKEDTALRKESYRKVRELQKGLWNESGHYVAK